MPEPEQQSAGNARADRVASPDSQTESGVGVQAAGAKDTDNSAALRLIAANARLNAIVLVSALVLTALGAWVYVGVKDSLREIRSGGLQTVLAAEVQALQIWIDDKKADAQRWANDARIRSYVQQRVELARVAGAGAFCTAYTRNRLFEVLQPFLKDEGSVTFNAIDRNGVIVASRFPEYCGARVQPATFLTDLTPVFEGKTKFIRPYPEKERISGARGIEIERPIAWIEAPVRDDTGEIIAALGFGKYADEQFANILRVARPGETGEVYAFDERGMMLSDSRFIDELRAIGLLRPGAASTMFSVQLRDPGGDLAAGHVPDLELEARPLTRMAAIAIASRNKQDPAQLRGIIVEPYRNYRGVEVIGAWQWLADYDMGVAIEVAAAEAYAPLKYLNRAAAVLLTLIAIAVAAVLTSAFYVQRLKRQVGDTRVVGQYRLEKQIGEGGMAKVYLAQHALLKRPTAVKMLKPHLATDEMIARFEREAQLVSRLVHPNTIEIYDYGRTRQGEFYYVMEYLEGETLDKVVAEGPLPVGRALHVLIQVCAALREAHGHGLVHRDVKPHNIMLCERAGDWDVVKLLDFGIVKDVEHPSTRDITQFQTKLGTPLYMAPERIRNPGDVDVRADIYSVGAVAFYLLTGRDLFEANGDHDLAYQILHTPPRRPSECAPHVPRRLDDLVVSCLAKDRTERPHDIIVVLALLEAAGVEYPWTQRDAKTWWQRRSSQASRAKGQAKRAVTGDK